jgi:hypothetical protein
VSPNSYTFRDHQAWRINYNPEEREVTLVQGSDLDEASLIILSLDQLPEFAQALLLLHQQENQKDPKP